MSMPRYTCAESTLTISTGWRAASCECEPRLAARGRAEQAVRDARLHRAAQEQLVEIGDRELVPGRPAVVAAGRRVRCLPSRAAARSFPVCVSTRLARTAAWQAIVAEQFVARALASPAGAVLAQFGEHARAPAPAGRRPPAGRARRAPPSVLRAERRRAREPECARAPRGAPRRWRSRSARPRTPPGPAGAGAGDVACVQARACRRS